MSTSPHTAPQAEPVNNPETEFDLLVQEAPQPSGAPLWAPDADHDNPGSPAADPGGTSVRWQAADPGGTSVSWRAADPGGTSVSWRAADANPRATAPHTGAFAANPTEYSVGDGLPGRVVSVLAMVAVAGVAVLNLSLVGALTFFFDLCFVVVCLVAAMAVRRRDLFTAAVLPPLVFAAVIAGVTVLAPEALLSTGGMVKVFLTGLAAHAEGLLGGYGVALVTVAARMIARRQG